MLHREIESGRCREYADKRQSRMDALLRGPCELCEGTGRHSIGVPCDACEGCGAVPPNTTFDPFEVENVRGFAAFLRDCGGFEIW